MNVLSIKQFIQKQLSGLNYKERINTLVSNIEYFPTTLSIASKDEVCACRDLQRWLHDIWLHTYSSGSDCSGALQLRLHTLESALANYANHGKLSGIDRLVARYALCQWSYENIDESIAYVHLHSIGHLYRDHYRNVYLSGLKGKIDIGVDLLHTPFVQVPCNRTWNDMTQCFIDQLPLLPEDASVTGYWLDGKGLDEMTLSADEERVIATWLSNKTRTLLKKAC